MASTGGAGEIQMLTPQRLRAAELGKHKALLAAIMRMATHQAVPDYERALAIPYRLLSDVEALAPSVVADLLATPQFGAWANDILRRLLGDESAPDGVPLPIDLGHLALFAATAAAQAGHPFNVEVPLRAGTASFPTWGIARVDADPRGQWGRAWLDGSGCHLRSLATTVDVPGTENSPNSGWAELPTITVTDRGLSIGLLLDDGDPFLDRYGSARIRVTAEELPRWRHLLTTGWQILAREHRSLAALVSGTVRTVVPLASPGPTRPASSTEEASFGAMALALPTDALAMAEVLVHETHHAVLGAIMDIEPLVRDGAGDPGQPGFLAYAPWRDDPRPAPALLQGIYAHYGIGRFWRQQYLAGPAGQRERAAAQFGRVRMMIARAAGTLAGSGLLTGAGQDLLASIQREVAAWLGEPLPTAVQQHVADLATDHESRWRIAHLRPDPAAIGALADAWRRGDPPPFPAGGVPARMHPGPLPAPAENLRFYLLAVRDWQPRLTSEPDGWPLDPADVALIRGDHEGAAEGYLRRIATGKDPDAWAGLAIARRWTGPRSAATLLAERPEVIASLHAQVSAGPGRQSDLTLPDRLSHWLAAT
jgi:HEXXH motif-containing protein